MIRFTRRSCRGSPVLHTSHARTAGVIADLVKELRSGSTRSKVSSGSTGSGTPTLSPPERFRGDCSSAGAKFSCKA
eukprot:1871236-Amphidinium_carterae.1